jgi:hypothetical protein
MPQLTAFLACSAAAIGMAVAGSVAHAAPITSMQAPGTSCGADSVITDNHTCQPFNAHCTGYDMMIIGRVDHNGHCVVPGVDGTSW